MAVVNRDMTIQDVLKLNPKTAAVFLQNGMHCIGCHIGFEEKIGEAAEAHGVDVEKLIKELNEAVAV
jgi:hybrid cluster-associated redox disulfide protein